MCLIITNDCKNFLIHLKLNERDLLNKKLKESKNLKSRFRFKITILKAMGIEYKRKNSFIYTFYF